MNKKMMLAMANFLKKAYGDYELKAKIETMYEKEGSFSLAIEPQEEFPGYKARVGSTETEEVNDNSKEISFEVYPDNNFDDNLILQTISEVAFTFASYYLKQ